MKDMIVMQEKEMRKESLWLIGFVILCCLMIIGLSSCSNDDVAEDDLSEHPTVRACSPHPSHPAIQQKLNELWKSKE